MQYYLSNNQRKQLVIRAGELDIVIPAPIVDPKDWLEWAKRSFCPQDSVLLAHAEPDVVTVAPSGGDGLSGYIGAILRDPVDGMFCWTIEVVRCRFRPAVKPRERAGRVQWPGFVLVDGRRIPPSE